MSANTKLRRIGDRMPAIHGRISQLAKPITPKNKPASSAAGNFLRENKTFLSVADTFPTVADTFPTVADIFLIENKSFLPLADTFLTVADPFLRENETFLTVSDPFCIENNRFPPRKYPILLHICVFLPRKVKIQRQIAAMRARTGSRVCDRIRSAAVDNASSLPFYRRQTTGFQQS